MRAPGGVTVGSSTCGLLLWIGPWPSLKCAAMSLRHDAALEDLSMPSYWMLSAAMAVRRRHIFITRNTRNFENTGAQ